MLSAAYSVLHITWTQQSATCLVVSALSVLFAFFRMTLIERSVVCQCLCYRFSHRNKLTNAKQSKSKAKAKKRCVMGVGMCLYAQLVQTKNKQCKSAIILQCYHPHLSDFCSWPRLTQPHNHIIYPGVAKIYLVFFWKCLLYLLKFLFLASCSIHLQFWVQKKIFLNHSDIYYLLI